MPRGVPRRTVLEETKEIMMAGKYTPLEQYLRDIPANQKEVLLSFEQIERIIHARLPPSAYEYWAWWA